MGLVHIRAGRGLAVGVLSGEEPCNGQGMLKGWSLQWVGH